MTVPRIALATLTLLFVAAPLHAQRPGMGQQQRQPMANQGMMGGMMGQGMMDQNMMQMMGQGMGLMATGGPGPAMILRMREVLELSQEQVQQLEQIQSRLQTQSMAETAMQAHQRARQALSGEDADMQAYESALREAADAMVEMHLEMARHTQEAQDVLTPDQRQRLEEISSSMMPGMMMGPGGGR